MSPAADTVHIMKILATLIVGVALGVASAESDQSEFAIPEVEPTKESENAGKRQLETPEVVLQLKYDRGELNRIYLAQFRKPKKAWSPSVSERSNVCADLCHAGLGGPVCGSSCDQLLPVGLQAALHGAPSANANANASAESYGQPRVAVCPALCDNYLGAPLCECSRSELKIQTVDWADICEAFCADGYTLGGCPTCETAAAPTAVPGALVTSLRALATVEGWTAWCDVQCRQGHGGAACNCDRTPFQ